MKKDFPQEVRMGFETVCAVHSLKERLLQKTDDFRERGKHEIGRVDAVRVRSGGFDLFGVCEVQLRDALHLDAKQTGNAQVYDNFGKRIDSVGQKEHPVDRGDQIDDHVVAFGLLVVKQKDFGLGQIAAGLKHEVVAVAVEHQLFDGDSRDVFSFDDAEGDFHRRKPVLGFFLRHLVQLDMRVQHMKIECFGFHEFVDVAVRFVEYQHPVDELDDAVVAGSERLFAEAFGATVGVVVDAADHAVVHENQERKHRTRAKRGERDDQHRDPDADDVKRIGQKIAKDERQDREKQYKDTNHEKPSWKFFQFVVHVDPFSFTRG